MKLQNILDLSTFEITRFRVWNQTSQPSDKGLGSKYFNTNSGHEAYGREQIYTPSGWRTAAYMDDIEAINEKLDLIFGDKIDTDTIIDSWKEVQDFLSGIEDTTTLMTMLDGKLDKSGGTITGDGVTIAMNGYPFIRFKSGDTAWGFIGFSDKGVPSVWDTITWRTLIHSGNVGDYAVLAKPLGIDVTITNLNQTGYGKTSDGWITTGPAIAVGSNTGYTMLIQQAAYNHSLLVSYKTGDGTVGAWKYIAFTDSDITGYSAGLKHSNGTVGAIVNSSGNVTIGGSDLAGSNMKLYVDGHITTSNNKALYGKDTSDNLRQLLVLDNGNDFVLGYGVSGAGYNTYLEGNNIYLRYGKSHAAGLILNSSGNVGIGTTTPQYKLDVAGDVGFSGLANLNGGALIPTGKNMMFGDASGNAIMEYDEDAGAIKITGSVYATGTVASGGKAQVGTGTGGSATVYPFTLTYGQAAYQIANPKSNTNVIVQVYEWNATTSSWDLILTDVNVTASKITVTFGRTTTVNHMVKVV